MSRQHVLQTTRLVQPPLLRARAPPVQVVRLFPVDLPSSGTWPTNHHRDRHRASNPQLRGVANSTSSGGAAGVVIRVGVGVLSAATGGSDDS